MIIINIILLQTLSETSKKAELQQLYVKNDLAQKLASEYNVPLEKALGNVQATAQKLIKAGVAV